VQIPPDLARDLGINPGPGVIRLPVPDWGRIAAYRPDWIERWNREIK
jgi:hypothetical protein